MKKNPLKGCNVELLEEEEDKISYAYRITHPKRGEYMLMRNEGNPFMLFVIGPNMATKLLGITWFRDGDKEHGPRSSALIPVH